MDLLLCIQKKLLLNDLGVKYENIHAELGHLHLFLEIMLEFCDGLLQEHLDMHKTVSWFPFALHIMFSHFEHLHLISMIIEVCTLV